MKSFKVLLLASFVIFGMIVILGTLKKNKKGIEEEFPLAEESAFPEALSTVSESEMLEKNRIEPVLSSLSFTPVQDDEVCPDRIRQIFSPRGKKLPIVETVTYKSRVPWLKGRPAWIADYASHYQTSRHFIARSLNGKADYTTQKVSSGQKFNVLNPEKQIEFYLMIDLSKANLKFYYYDKETEERVLLKKYKVGLGRLDEETKSGCLTPVGRYTLGEKIAIYRPGVTSYFQDKEMEMIQIFGTRWIPFDQELEGCSESPEGYGIHGSPWIPDPETGELKEERNSIGKYESDGCIRLNREDMEELFSIVITKPTVVEVVQKSEDAHLPGIESAVFKDQVEE